MRDKPLRSYGGQSKTRPPKALETTENKTRLFASGQGTHKCGQTSDIRRVTSRGVECTRARNRNNVTTLNRDRRVLLRDCSLLARVITLKNGDACTGSRNPA